MDNTLKNKIYKYFFLLAIISIIIVTILNIFTTYKLLSKKMEFEVKNNALLLSDIINSTDLTLSFLDKKTLEPNYRISIIDKNGKVTFDNYNEILNMENHINRPEIIEALENGYGESSRFSKTLGEKTYYYAVLLDSQDILRISKTTNDIFNILKTTFPTTAFTVIIIIILCHYTSLTLVKRIVKPINNIDLQSDKNIIYDELSPLIKTIELQKNKINEQFYNLESRTKTINTITENMNEGILLFDNKLNILLSNQSVKDIFSIKQKNIEGKKILNIIRNVNFQTSLEKALLGSSSNISINVNSRIIEVLINPVNLNNEIIGAVALFIDITQKANDEKLRKEFSANVSHELKTPLTTILGLSELIYNDMVNEKDIKSFCLKIKNESERLLVLIENIIKISKLDEKIYDTSFELINITSIINEVVNILQLKAIEKDIEIKIFSNNELINADRQMLFELIYNLVENGIKYNKQNGTINIKTVKESEKVTIEVSDTGIGINSTDRDRIFERFYRADKSRSKKTGGSGLGLSIVKHIVEHHNGKIYFESELDKGSKFTVIL